MSLPGVSMSVMIKEMKECGPMEEENPRPPDFLASVCAVALLDVSSREQEEEKYQ